MMDWWTTRPPMLKGTALMLAAVVFFSGLLLLIRVVGQALPIVLVIVARQVVMQALIMLQAGAKSRTILRTSNLKLQLWRAVLTLGSTFATYITFVYLPLALASAISFSTALFVTIGAALFLKERVDWKTWTATIVGLGGVYIMLDPTEPGSLFWVMVAIAGAIFSAATILTVRVFDPDEPIHTVLTYQGLLILPVLIVPTLLTWQTPTPWEWVLLLVIGVLATLGQWTFVSAYRYAEAARLAPLDFFRLVLLALAGLLFFNEQLHPMLLVGMVIVVATTLYTIRANARAKPVVVAEVPQIT